MVKRPLPDGYRPPGSVPYDPDLWGEPQQPPTPLYRCLTCDDTITPNRHEAHAKVCLYPPLKRLEGK